MANEEILKSYLLIICRREKKLIKLEKCATHFGKRIKELYRNLNAKIIEIPGSCTK